VPNLNLIAPLLPHEYDDRTQRKVNNARDPFLHFKELAIVSRRRCLVSHQRVWGEQGRRDQGREGSRTRCRRESLDGILEREHEKPGEEKVMRHRALLSMRLVVVENSALEIVQDAGFLFLGGGIIV
jgi:hypothetical protein